MYISKSRFINWTRCPMYFAMELKHNPMGMSDIDDEAERRREMMEEIHDGMSSSESYDESDEETFDASPSLELETLLPYYNRVENEALKVASNYFHGKFVADYMDVHNQKLFEYEQHGHIYRCYVDIYNENEDEINIIEVKATTNSKYSFKIKMKGDKKEREGLFFSDVPEGKRAGKDNHYYPLFVKDGNIWRLNFTDSAFNADTKKNFDKKKAALLNRYSDLGKYPHDLAFQRFVIEHALRKAGDNRPVNFYLAVLNNEYVYDGKKDAAGECIYDPVDGQEIITFYDMNDISKEYQSTILKEIATLESYISTPHDTGKAVPVGLHCAWGKNTECVFWEYCAKQHGVDDLSNMGNKYLYSKGHFGDHSKDKYDLVNKRLCKFDDIPIEWLEENVKSYNRYYKIQRDCYDGVISEYVKKDKMRYWFGQIDYPIYHFDFETFPCPLPRFSGENPYRQSPFEFSLHIEHEPVVPACPGAVPQGVCDMQKDNYIFLNKDFKTDERKDLVEAIISHFDFNEDGTLHGTMLAQNTSFERGRLTELAELFPEEHFPGIAKKLLAIRDKSMDLIDLLRTNKDFYKKVFGEDAAATINYYHKDLSGSYSIKKTLPVLVPSLSYAGMEVGNGSQAYIAYINYDSTTPTVFDGKPMYTKADRRQALKTYCQQDTWAMVEILRAVRAKI